MKTDDSAVDGGRGGGAAGDAGAGREALAVPATLTHQGRVFDGQGTPITQTLDVVFTILRGNRSEAGATELWKEYVRLTGSQGIFRWPSGRRLRSMERCSTGRCGPWESRWGKMPR